jgi:hypothetical protein
MDKLKINNKIYIYEKSPNLSQQLKIWNNQNMFVEKLKYLQDNLNTHVINHIKIYRIDNLCWDDKLLDLIQNFNHRPTDLFIDSIFRFNIKTQKKIFKIKGAFVQDKIYIKIESNQFLILDSLMYHGSQKKYADKEKKYRYSEHAGLLDFKDNILYKILVYGDTNRIDKSDSDIFLPGDIDEAPNYEYIFHTHPAAPKPGGRVNINILYEYPSIGDIFNFIDNHNNGFTQGSLVITAEGLYLIKKKNHDLKKIKINEDELFINYLSVMDKIQKKLIKKYGKDFTDEYFYSVIAQDKMGADELNKLLNDYDLGLDFYPRIKNDIGDWFIGDVYLPVYQVG